MLLEGTYLGNPIKVVISEKESGAVMVEISCRILNQGCESDRITARQCLIAKDGTISDIGVGIIKDIFSVSSLEEIVALQEVTEFGVEVELVLESEEYKGKTRLAVKYIQLPGGGLSKPVDGPSFIKKYGARFRAVIGPVAAKTAAPAAGKPAPPPAAAKAKTPPPPPVKKKEIAPSTKDECWELFVNDNKDLEDQDLYVKWAKLVTEMLPGVDEPTDAQWGIVKNAIDDEIPF